MRLAIQATDLAGDAETPRAGVARYSYQLVENLLTQMGDDELHLFARESFRPPQTWRQNPRFHFHPISRRYRTWLSAIREWEALRLRIDFWFTCNGSIPRLKFAKRGIMIHDLFPLDYPELLPAESLPFYRKEMARACHDADLIVVNSQATRRSVEKWFPTAEPKVAVAHLGAGNEMSQTGDAKVFPELEGKPYLLAVSTLEPRKNLPRLVEAMALVKNKNLNLAVVGKLGWNYEEIFQRVEALDLKDRIMFLGYVADADLPDLYKKSEAFVCAAIDEGFGIPVLEAMLMDSPVLLSDAGALPEVGGDAAIYFKPDSVEAIAAAIDRHFEGSSNRAKRVADGKAQAQKFSWEENASVTLAAIRKVLSP